MDEDELPLLLRKPRYRAKAVRAAARAGEDVDGEHLAAAFPGVAAAAEDGCPDAADVGRLAARVVRWQRDGLWPATPVEWLLAFKDSRHG